jgi:GNAT superfamily N-acetyltransferase
MEPDNPDFWPTLFTSARFVPLATYSSSLVTDLSRRAPGAERAGKRLEQAGIQIRNLDPTHIEEDLRRIYHVSVSSFSRNFLYQEIPEAAFLAQYLPLKEHVRPELVLIAELNDRPAGYFFSIPDYAEAMRDQPVRTVIGKTLAVLPGRQFAGLGILLTGRLHERAKSLGYTRVIHALEHDANPSRNISNFFGAPMRRYALYSRRLT